MKQEIKNDQSEETKLALEPKKITDSDNSKLLKLC